jgi:hypothetical protein
MMRREAFYMIVSVLLILSACAKQQGEEFFPKASIGAQWEYTLVYETPAGAQKGRIVISIDGKETIHGETYYKQVSLISGLPGQKPQISYNRRTKEGIYKIDDNHKDKPEYLMIPFPIAVGSTWTVQSPDGQTYYRAEKIEPMTLPSRKYDNCLKLTFKVDREAVHIEGFSYLAPDVGEILCVQQIGEDKLAYYLDKYKL